MIDFVITVIYFLKNLTHLTLFISYTTGLYLITALSYIFDILKVFGKIATSVLSVIGEDFLIFLGDLLQKISYLLCSIFNLFEYIFQMLSSTYNGVKFSVEYILTSITFVRMFIINFFTKCLWCLGQIISGIKYLLVLVGSGMWFAITLIPLCFVYIGTMTTYYYGRLLEEIYEIINDSFNNFVSLLKAIYDFIVDVPIESSIGLIAAACIVYMIVEFQMVLYEMILRRVNKAKNCVFSYANVLKNLFKSKNVAKRRNAVINEDNFIQHFCTICQESEKCILFLPCKHVTVCASCNEKLRNYGYFCPICRTAIKRFMEIYV